MEEKLLKIINKFGINNQQRKLAEEVFELNEAIISYEKEKSLKELLDIKIIDSDIAKKKHIAEELADVMVILEQIKLYYEITSKEITDIFWNKVDRTIDRIEEGYYENNI